MLRACLYPLVQLFQLLRGPISLGLTIRCGQQYHRGIVLSLDKVSSRDLVNGVITLVLITGVDTRVEQMPLSPEDEEVQSRDPDRVYLPNGRTEIGTGYVGVQVNIYKRGA